jgi:4-hydroxy-tetrahydrodipicolinate reductase
MDPALRGRSRTACAAGGTSIHSTGSSPGFITEALPLVLTSIQRRLDGLVINEYADLSERNSPGLLFEVMGFGRAPEAFSPARLSHGRESFGPSLRLLAEALSLPLDAIEASGEVAVRGPHRGDRRGHVEAGTVAAQQIIVAGMREGRPLLQFRATWYCTSELDPAWDTRPTGWRVVVDGDAPLDVALPFPVRWSRWRRRRRATRHTGRSTRCRWCAGHLPASARPSTCHRSWPCWGKDDACSGGGSCSSRAWPRWPHWRRAQGETAMTTTQPMTEGIR